MRSDYTHTLHKLNVKFITIGLCGFIVSKKLTFKVGKLNLYYETLIPLYYS